MKVNMQKILFFSIAKSWTFLAIVLELGVVASLPAFDISRPHPNTSERAINFPSHIADDNSFSSPSSFHLDSSSSSLHKIIRLHQPYAQPTRTGAFHLHKIIHKLSFHKDNSKNQNPNVPILPRQAPKSGIASTINVKSVNGSFLIKSSNDTAASRLKRQLEGIFHVREAPSSSTVIPILPSEESNSNEPTRKSLFTNPQNRRRVNGLANVNKSHLRINSTKTTKVETRKEKKFPKAFELAESPSPTETPHSLVTHKWKPPLGSSTASPNKSPYRKNANNVTVEIIETSRRTVIKHDGVNNHDGGETPGEISFDDDKLTTTPNGQRNVPPTSLQEESSLLKSTPIFRSIRPRLKNPNKRFRQPGQQQVSRSLLNESPSVPEDSSTFIEDTSITSPRPRRRSSSSNKGLNLPQREIILEDLTRPTVDVKVSSFQEQIPYNDREVSEADLQDYLEGHATFGAKGNFKHTVSRNITGFIPHHESSSEVKRSSHGVYKRTPQPPLNSEEIHSHRKRNFRRNNNERDENEGVSISQADVKKFRGGNGGNPKMTIYTASGVKYAPSTEDEEDLGKKFYEYSGGKSNKNSNRKAKERRDDRDDSSREDNNSHQFDELFKQGHPAIAKPPQVIYKSHPLGVPYGRVEDEDLYESPLRADPLSDDVPLKFDPASDVFYGNPKADKDKTLAQSNRPAPVRVENNGDNNEERTTTRHPYRRREEIGKRIGESEGPDENGRYYPPPEEDEGSRSSSRGPRTNYGPSGDDDQRYFKDFVSLDDNFQQLPRPSKEDESFSSLIPPEANDYDDDGGYGDEDDGYNSRGGGRGRGSSSSTSGYDRDERETTDRNRDRERYNKDEERDDEDVEREGSRNERGEEGRRASSSRRPPSRGNRGQYDEDAYDDFGLNQEGVSPQYFDSSYVDALKHFDDEIKKLEQHERQVVSTENPQSTSDGATREPPLIISSPGPAVSYERSNLPRPTETPEPTHYERPGEEGRHSHRGKEEEENKPGPPSSETKDGGEEEEEERRGEAEEPEEEEEGEEVDEGPQEASTIAKKEDSDGGEEDSDEESQPEKRGVKVVETEEVKRVRQEDKPSNSTTNSSAKDTAGNIDDDISGIEKEYGGK